MEQKSLKNVPASGFSLSYHDLWQILLVDTDDRILEVEMDFPSHGSQLSLAFLLSKSVVHGM